VFFRTGQADFGRRAGKINALTIIFIFTQIQLNRISTSGSLMAETMICPHCKGTSVNYVIVTQDGKPTIQSVPCVVCEGKGHLPAPAPKPAAPPPPPPPPSPEIWPIFVPLGIFALFFAFLWV
jgi:hypothetical protein